jgi:hypothetical protein
MPIRCPVVSYTVKVRSGSLRTPEEWSIVGILTRERVLAVTIRLGLERSDELRVTSYTVVLFVDLFARKFQYGIWLEPFYGTSRLGEVGKYLYQPGERNDYKHPYRKEERIFFQPMKHNYLPP